MLRAVFSAALLAAELDNPVPPSAENKESVIPAASATAVTEKLIGRVTDANGEPVANARISVAGRDLSALTGADGRYMLLLGDGSHDVTVRADGFEEQVFRGVSVAKSAGATLDVRLLPSSNRAHAETAGAGDAQHELGAISVEGQAIKDGSDTAVVLDRRYSPQVVDILGAEQISRAGDSDVGAALKRVTGLSLVDGKHVYVRGLGERYSSVVLNGAQIPSPDPTRRVVPLDLFPTSVLSSIAVQKSYSADMPGEFAGGTVGLNSRGVPNDFQLNVALTGKFLDGTTGDQGLRYRGGGKDWLGDGIDARKFPDGITPFPTDPAAREKVSEQVAARGYRTYKSKIDPGAVFGFGVGDSFDVGGWSLGYLGALRYSHEWATRKEQRRSYSLALGQLEQRSDFERSRTERMIDQSALVSLGAKRGRQHDVGITFMKIRQASDETRIDEGWDTQATDRDRNYRLRWIENALTVKQVHGDHKFDALSNLEVDWLYSHSGVTRDEPNTRSYKYEQAHDGSFAFARGSNNNDQLFAYLGDTMIEKRIDAKLPLRFSDDFTATLQTGLDRVSRGRGSYIRKFQFRGSRPADAPPDIWNVLTPEYIRPGGLLLQEVTQATDAYRARQKLDAGYFATELNWADRYRLHIGVRREDNLQRVETYQLFAPNPTPIVGEINQVNWLPTAAFTWAYAEGAQLRLSFSKTVSRPDFREMSRAQFIDPELDIATRGNPDLKQTGIRNLDLRWEYYFSDTESFSVALFDKRFDNPIERVNQAGTGALLELKNAADARNRGIEIDYTGSLAQLRRWSWIDKGAIGRLPLEQLYAGFNYARIESQVDLGANAGIQTSTRRALQGQSPYVANLQLGYRSEDGKLESTLLFNVFGRRISQAGEHGVPDIYEEPFRQVDLVTSWVFSERWKMKIQARNLLDPDVNYTQGGLTTLRYRRGREFSLGMEWAW